MLNLSAAAIIEKNRLSSEGAWLVLLEIEVPGVAEHIRIARNTEAVNWNSYAWEAFPFDIDPIADSGDGEIQSLTIRVSNVTRIVQAYLEESGGGVGAVVTVRVVHSQHLALTEAEVEEEFSVTGTSCDDAWVYFTLGPSYPVYARRPERRYLKNFCPFEYGGIECAVGADTRGVYPNCAKTLVACRQRGNAVRFGGEPSIPGGFYV